MNFYYEYARMKVVKLGNFGSFSDEENVKNNFGKSRGFVPSNLIMLRNIRDRKGMGTKELSLKNRKFHIGRPKKI